MLSIALKNSKEICTYEHDIEACTYTIGAMEKQYILHILSVCVCVCVCLYP